MHFGEPVVLVIISVTGALLPGIVIGEPELGVVTSEHGALFEGMLHRALVVRTGLLKHIIEYFGAPTGALGILAICGCDEIGLEGLLLPQASLFLFLGETGGRGPGASSLRFPFVSPSGKMAPTASSPEAKLVAMSRSAAAEVGMFWPNSWTRS